MLISEPEAILNTNSATNLFDNIYTGNMQTDISHVDFGRTRVQISRIFLPKKLQLCKSIRHHFNTT